MQDFPIAVPDEVLDDLRRRLLATRMSPDFANPDWRYGVEGEYLQELVAYWLDEYDWRVHEARMNEYSHCRTMIDEVPLHFIRERGIGPAPVPLILSHGWPWTFWDYEHVIRPLADPAAFGGDPADAFDVVVPSLPGFGFSSPLDRPGVNWSRTADLWVELMDRLGYERFAAFGGDLGNLISAQLGHKYPAKVIGVHLSGALPLSLFESGIWTAEDYAADELDEYRRSQERMSTIGRSHLAVQTEDPQTLAYALHDSPVGLLAWLVERRRAWSDCDGEVERRFTKDELLTTVTLYWVTGTIGTSMRHYWEAAKDPWRPVRPELPVVQAPTAILHPARELAHAPAAWAGSYYNLKRYRRMPAGGHFFPSEEPELVVEEVRAFFRGLRAKT